MRRRTVFQAPLSTASALLAVSLLTVSLLTMSLLAGCSEDRDEAVRDQNGSTSTTAASPSEAADVDSIGQGTLDRYADYRPDIYTEPANWVCHPGSEDVCDDGLDATVIQADGTATIEEWNANPDVPIDCFYVYPTISLDPSDVSDRVAGDEERFVTLNQAARLGQTCRVFAPVYRQRTLMGLASLLAGPGAEGVTSTTEAHRAESDAGYVDVLDAFRTYMATENDGRGFVLIGHSQGASVLNRLMQEEVDPNVDVRDHLVAAYLAGWPVRVPEGADVGGDFVDIPLCRSAEQTGCVISWASFRQSEPPVDGALFGRPRAGEGAAACNSPASLSGGSAQLRSYFPSDPSASILSALGVSAAGEKTWADGLEVTTPFVTAPGLVSGECVSRDGFDYLEVVVNGDPSDPRIDDIGGDLTPAWGLHLQDVNLVMGDIVALVSDQAASWSSGRE